MCATSEFGVLSALLVLKKSGWEDTVFCYKPKKPIPTLIPSNDLHCVTALSRPSVTQAVCSTHQWQTTSAAGISGSSCKVKCGGEL